MSSENHMNNSEKEVDEVDAALSDLEITLEGGKTSTILVRTVSAASFTQWVKGQFVVIQKSDHQN